MIDKNYKFKGWDWTELSEGLGIDIKADRYQEMSWDSENLLATDTRQLMRDLVSDVYWKSWGNVPKEQKDAMRLINRFMESVIKASHSTDKSVFKAIYDLGYKKNAFTQLQWLDMTLECWWT